MLQKSCPLKEIFCLTILSKCFSISISTSINSVFIVKNSKSQNLLSKMVYFVNITTNLKLDWSIVATYSVQLWLGLELVSVQRRNKVSLIVSTETEAYSKLSHKDNNFILCLSWKIRSGWFSGTIHWKVFFSSCLCCCYHLLLKL